MIKNSLIIGLVVLFGINIIFKINGCEMNNGFFFRLILVVLLCVAFTNRNELIEGFGISDESIFNVTSLFNNNMIQSSNLKLSGNLNIGGEMNINGTTISTDTKGGKITHPIAIDFNSDTGITGNLAMKKNIFMNPSIENTENTYTNFPYSSSIIFSENAGLNGRGQFLSAFNPNGGCSTFLINPNGQTWSFGANSLSSGWGCTKTGVTMESNSGKFISPALSET